MLHGTARMCGIAGFFSTVEAVAPTDLAHWAEALRHRGPDASGRYHAGRLGMVHTRLAIIDLAGGAQPLYTADRQLCAVVNGEIYNHVELREELQARGHRFTTHSDCETLLHTYREYGERFVERLYGMFAFALYDVQRDRLLLGRDRLGIKPLFLQADRTGVKFASEIRALLKPGVPPRVDAEALLHYFHSNFISGARTPVCGIEKVLPGEVVEVRAGRITTRRRYWRLADVETEDLSYGQAARRFDDLMATVIPQHLRADVPLGVFLSGGLDSSLLVALIRRYSAQPLHTYSIGFGAATGRDELPAARRIAREFQTTHTELALTRRDLLGVLPRSIAVAGELMADYANLPTYLLAERARHDVKVVLSGEGGDEVFAGYGRYRPLRIQRLWHALRRPGSGGFRVHGLPNAATLDALFPDLPHARSRARQPFIDAWHAANPRWSVLARMQHTDIATWLADDLMVKSDRMLMAHGVEGRVPFLDHRVVEFGLALPDRLKVQGRSGKVFLRRWAEQFLPPAALQRKKQGFTVPVGDWLRGAPMQRLAALCLTHPGLQSMSSVVRSQLLQRHCRAASEPAFVWALLNFGLWDEAFVHTGETRLHDWTANTAGEGTSTLHA